MSLYFYILVIDSENYDDNQKTRNISRHHTTFSSLFGQENVILDATNLFTSGETEQGLLTLRQFDSTIGGFGLHSLAPGATIPFERKLYRPIQYIEMHLTSNTPDNFTRYIAEAACAHVEAILKKSTRLSFLSEIRDDKPVPMGTLINKAKHLIPPLLYDDLVWLNKEVYTFTKHEYRITTLGTPYLSAY